jgi:hypothetical protein
MVRINTKYELLEEIPAEKTLKKHLGSGYKGGSKLKYAKIGEAGT